MNIKNILFSSVVAVSSIFGGVTGAEAKSYECYWNVSNNHICVYNVRGNRSFREYDMDINGRYAGKQRVRCNEAHRYNYKENANGIVCFEFN